MKGINDTPFRKITDLPGCGDPVLHCLENYWKTLRRTHIPPLRNDIEPRRLQHALSHTFILQRVAPGIARMRVAGQHLHDLLKMDPRGMSASALFEPSERCDIADLIEAAFQEPAIIAAPLVSPGGLLRPSLKGRILFLPLNDDYGCTTRILGAIVTDGQIGNRPRRFTIPKGAIIRHETLNVATTQTNQEKRPDAKRPALRLVINNS